MCTGLSDAAAITTDTTAKPAHLAEAWPQAGVVARVEQAGKKRKIITQHNSQQVT